MSTSSAPAATAYFTSASLTSRLVRPLGNAVATLATCTPLPWSSAAATWARSGYTQTAATAGAVGSAGSGRLALAHSARTLPGVSWPSSVVRSIIEMAASSAHCLAVVLIDRLASMAARVSAPALIGDSSLYSHSYLLRRNANVASTAGWERPARAAAPGHRRPRTRGGRRARAWVLKTKKSQNFRLEVTAAAMPRSVDIAPCDHEGRDHHRVVPARRQWRCALRPAGRGTPHQPRPPPARHRAPAAGGEQTGADLVSVPGGARTRRPAARLPGFPAGAAQPPGPGRARQAPGRGGAPGQPGRPGRARRRSGPAARPARGRGVPDRPAVLRPGLPARPGRRGVRLAVAARHPQRRRAHAGPVHGHRDRPARAGHR